MTFLTVLKNHVSQMFITPASLKQFYSLRKKIKSGNKESFSQKDGYFRKERSVYKIGNINYSILQTQYMNSVYKIVNT